VKIFKTELVTSAAAQGPRAGLVRDDIAQVAFVGRSNVGKSSLLNALTRQKVARTSAAAGKTRQANIYRVSAEGGTGGPGAWEVYLVDLPGYGYARGGDASAEELAAVVDAYFAAARGDSGRPGAPPAERAVIQLIDARHPRLPSDLDAHAWLTTAHVPPQIVATKIDKLSRSERVRNLRDIEQAFGSAPIAVSALKGEGLDLLWRTIAGIARGIRF
jgi:GTP-binding protein